MTMEKVDKQAVLSNQDELIGLIYDAVLMPALWPELLQKINQYISDSAPLPKTNGGASATVNESAHSILVTHFKRAVKIRRKMLCSESISSTLTHVLNQLSVGVVLVKRDATVVMCNSLAEVMIQESSILSLQHRQLQASMVSQTRVLHGLIRDSLVPSVVKFDKDYCGMMNLESLDESAAVWVTSELTEIHSSLQYQEALAAVFIMSETQRSMVSLTSFFEQFDISNAESRLVAALVHDCHTLNGAAEQLCITKHTVRTQMKSILSKSNCNSQVELMKKILMSPAAIFAEPIQELVQLRMNTENEPEHASMRLFDGRRLVWKEFGAAHGEPVIVFHSLTGAHPNYQVACDLGIRLIVPERPGAHGSDPQPGRKIIDWADDVEQLVDHLGIEQFSLLGYSAGGPYALACLDKIPQRIKNLALISSMAAIRSEQDLTGMLPLNHTALRLAYESPDLMVDFMKVVLNELEENPSSYFDNVSGHQPFTDKLFLAEEKVQAHFNYAFQAAAKENIDQLCDEIVLLASGWSVNVDAFQGQVHIWHGLDDPLVPIEMGRRTANMFAHVNRYFLKGEGNYLVYTHWEEILTTLVGSKR